MPTTVSKVCPRGATASAASGLARGPPRALRLAMTLPRRVSIGTFMITRRCVQRRLLLKPEEGKQLGQGLLYVILLGAKKFEVLVHGLTIMSNHYHLVVTPTRKNLPRFLHWINLLMAKLVNVHRRRPGAVWSSVDKTSVVHLADANAALEKLEYATNNPVEAGLVSDAAEWPGIRTLPTDVGTKLVARRPDFYFRSEADVEREEEEVRAGRRRRRGTRNPPLPPVVEVELTPPPLVAAEMSLADFRALYARRVEEGRDAIRARFAAAGRTFLGAWGVVAQNPEGIPGEPGTPELGLSPSVATRDKWRRVELLQHRAEFLVAYRDAWGAFRDGNRNVRFPEDTYGPCVLYGARCYGDPPDNAGAGAHDPPRPRRAAA